VIVIVIVIVIVYRELLRLFITADAGWMRWVDEVGGWVDEVGRINCWLAM